MAIESLKCHNHRGRVLLEKTETCKETGGGVKILYIPAQFVL